MARKSSKNSERKQGKTQDIAVRPQRLRAGIKEPEVAAMYKEIAIRGLQPPPASDRAALRKWCDTVAAVQLHLLTEYGDQLRLSAKSLTAEGCWQFFEENRATAERFGVTEEFRAITHREAAAFKGEKLSKATLSEKLGQATELD